MTGTAQQWGKVTESAFTTRLDTTGNAVRVYGVLACKAGRTRRAWMSQTTMAERLGISTRTVHRAIKRLIAAELIKVVGRIVVDPTKGTWLPIYLVAPLGASDLSEVTPSVQSGVGKGDPTGQSGVPDVTAGGTRPDTQVSDIQYLDSSSSSISKPSANSPLRGSPTQEQERIEEEERESNGKANPKEFWFKGQWRPYGKQPTGAKGAK
jgi:Helix-turn-helix domain